MGVEGQLDYILFAGGLAMLVLGAIAWSLSHKTRAEGCPKPRAEGGPKPRAEGCLQPEAPDGSPDHCPAPVAHPPAWRSFALFALLQSLTLWLDILHPWQPAGQTSPTLRFALASTALILLADAAVTALVDVTSGVISGVTSGVTSGGAPRRRTVLRIAAAVTLIALAAPAGVATAMEKGSDPFFSRLLILLPTAFAAAWLSRAFRKRRGSAAVTSGVVTANAAEPRRFIQMALLTRIAAALILLIGLVAAASPLQLHATPLLLVGGDWAAVPGLFPGASALLLTLFAWALAACLWRIAIRTHRRRFSAAVAAALVFILAVGLALTELEGQRENRAQRRHLLTIARTAAAGIPVHDVLQLSATQDDLDQPAYHRLKRQLILTRSDVPNASFVYVMLPIEDRAVFLADSEPLDSPDMSLPGDAYPEASDELLSVLAGGDALVEGPLPDNWGVWVSGLAPIFDERPDGSRRVAGLLGIDIDATDFLHAIAMARLRAIGLTGAAAILMLACATCYRRIRDTTDQLQHSRQRTALHMDQTLLGLIEMDAGFHVTAWNRAAQRIFGYAPHQALGRHAVDLIVPPNARPQVDNVLLQLTAEHLPVRSTNDNITADGRTITCEWFNTPLIDTHGRVMGYASMVQDVSDRRAMELQLRDAATRDRLTGLPNRALFMDRLAQAIKRHHRDKTYHFAVLFLDFDRFKIINDSLGHEVGDQLLSQIAARLTHELRDVDSVSRVSPPGADSQSGPQYSGPNPARRDAQPTADAQSGTPYAVPSTEYGFAPHTAGRLGGDEFVVLLDGIRHADSAAIVADRLLAAIARPFNCSGHELFCTASIGIVTSDEAPDRPEDVLRDADTAMYEAKIAGKGRYAVFDVSMRQRVQERHSLENELRRAMGGDQFFLAYQPILCLESGRIDSFEVLVRWKHPTRGLVSPGEFIPIAEETGLIVPLGDWIVREACRQLAAWRDARGSAAPTALSINLSRRQLIQPDLAERLEQITTDAGIPMSSLHLEITESAVMEDSDHARRVLRQLQRLGFKLAMDDFGTGYSSLSCLHQFPLDVLKIDRSFVSNLLKGSHFGALVNAIITLARSLGISVVAEGVESAEQMHMLQTMDCHFAQGYLFAAPLPIDDAMRYTPRPLPDHDAAA